MKNKLLKAVENKNVPEVEEILKQCTQEILEFAEGEVRVHILQFADATRLSSSFATLILLLISFTNLNTKCVFLFIIKNLVLSLVQLCR